MTRDEARRRAEEALAHYETCPGGGRWRECSSALAVALRALLAAEPEAVVCDGHGETYDEVYRDRERLRESVEIERDGQRSMVRALAEIHRLSRLDVAISLASDAPSPARDAVREAKAARPKGDIWDACGCPNPDDCEHVFYEPAPSDAVREAAEIIRAILTAHDARLSDGGCLTYGHPRSGTGFPAAIEWLRRYDAAKGGGRG